MSEDIKVPDESLEETFDVLDTTIRKLNPEVKKDSDYWRSKLACKLISDGLNTELVDLLKIAKREDLIPKSA